MPKIILIVDDVDYKAIKEAMADRENSMPLPDGEGNLDGRVIAEICRGWQEMANMKDDYHDEGENWKYI